mmetsp:Transcript_79263/g.171365  ORF Transcript_79263/g.171365 Transcript_79263/m.171365 type:complete len:228 (-) Transcript_79263:145-828(-)
MRGSAKAALVLAALLPGGLGAAGRGSGRGPLEARLQAAADRGAPQQWPGQGRGQGQEQVPRDYVQTGPVGPYGLGDYVQHGPIGPYGQGNVAHGRTMGNNIAHEGNGNPTIVYGNVNGNVYGGIYGRVHGGDVYRNYDAGDDYERAPEVSCGAAPCAPGASGPGSEPKASVLGAKAPAAPVAHEPSPEAAYFVPPVPAAAELRIGASPAPAAGSERMQPMSWPRRCP